MGLLERLEKLETKAGMSTEVPYELLRDGMPEDKVKEILEKKAKGLINIINIHFVESPNGSQ